MSHRPRPVRGPGAAAPPACAGTRLHQQGDYAGAARHFEQALEREPDSRTAHWGAGRAYLRLRQPQRALPHLQHAVDACPADPDARFDLAQVLLESRRPADAADHLDRVVQLRPGWAEAWCSLGYSRLLAGQPAEAESTLRRALAIRPDYPEALSRLAVAVRDDPRRLPEAEELLLRAIALRPNLVEAWNGLGMTLVRQNKLEPARQAYHRALQFEPRNSAVKFNLAEVGLLRGELCRETWMHYEYRWVVLHENPRRGFAQPVWRGEPLAGRSILLHPEQGAGDTLQFVRYVPLLAAQGATVHVQVQPALKALLADLPGAASVLAQGEALPDFDLQCPLLSLPFACDTRLPSIPAQVPYVTAPPGRIAQWAAALPPASGQPRIGVVWRGNPRHANDANRSIPLGTFQSLFDAPHRTFVPLQLDIPAGEAALLSRQPALTRLTTAITDFADTAALLEHLDLLITVDTSVAHLAGAMGRPVWVLLPFAPDWRWMLQRADSPWYPTMRLFRQPRIGDWETVLATVRAELQRPGFAALAPELAELQSA